jgi:signal transduction histidine kinase
MLLAATDQRNLQSAGVATNDAVVAVANDRVRMIGSILEVLPATTNIVVICGNSLYERFWLQQFQRDLQSFTNRLSFTWFNDLSFPEMLERTSLLPPRTAIFYAVLFVDAAGVPYPGQRTLTDLHAVANAPIFGSCDSQLGHGIVGGPLISIEDLARNTAKVAARILQGEAPGGITTPVQTPGPPVYDWRELRRWGISERILPGGSLIRFRQSTLWEQYRASIIIASLIAAGAFTWLFLRHAAYLGKLKSGREAFTRELILSQENERKRIASELHDCLGQDLLLIKNRLGLMTADVKQLPDVLTQLKELSVAASRAIADVRSISHALRPAALEQVGLTKAIEWMIEQLGETSPTRFSCELDNIDGLLPPDSGMNFYRIIQEALNNVIKHAQATEVIVSVKRDPFGIALSIHDNGRGLNSQNLVDAHSQREKIPTLGLVSMAERAKLLAAEIEIQSAEGKGTRLTLALPLPQFQNQRPAEICADRIDRDLGI